MVHVDVAFDKARGLPSALLCFNLDGNTLHEESGMCSTEVVIIQSHLAAKPCSS